MFKHLATEIGYNFVMVNNCKRQINAIKTAINISTSPCIAKDDECVFLIIMNFISKEKAMIYQNIGDKEKFLMELEDNIEKQKRINEYSLDNNIEKLRKENIPIENNLELSEDEWILYRLGYKLLDTGKLKILNYLFECNITGLISDVLRQTNIKDIFNRILASDIENLKKRLISEIANTANDITELERSYRRLNSIH